MDYDREKLEDLESRLDGYLASLESAREFKRAAELNLNTAVVAVHRASSMPLSLFDPPGRFKVSGGANFIAEFHADPARVLALFRKEAPDHSMTPLLEHHAECRAALERAERRLEECQRRVNSLSPTVSRCREFLRRAAA